MKDKIMLSLLWVSLAGIFVLWGTMLIMSDAPVEQNPSSFAISPNGTVGVNLGGGVMIDYNGKVGVGIGF